MKCGHLEHQSFCPCGNANSKITGSEQCRTIGLRVGGTAVALSNWEGRGGVGSSWGQCSAEDLQCVGLAVTHPTSLEERFFFAFMSNQVLYSLLKCPKLNELGWQTTTQASAEG